MQELFIEFLDVITEEDLVADSSLIISENILADVAISPEILSSVYSTVCKSLAVFKNWMSIALEFTEDAVNAILGLQLLYNMVTEHFRQVSDSNEQISLPDALQDIEATLIKHFQKLRDLAKKQITAPAFGKLPLAIQNQIRGIEQQTPMSYWLSVRIEVMKSLIKIPMYAK
jgi:hypothetical protein